MKLYDSNGRFSGYSRIRKSFAVRTLYSGPSLNARFHISSASPSSVSECVIWRLKKTSSLGSNCTFAIRFLIDSRMGFCGFSSSLGMRKFVRRGGSFSNFRVVGGSSFGKELRKSLIEL